MKQLNMFGCNMGDDGFVQMSSSIHNVERLGIGSNNDDNLTLTGIIALSEAVKKLNKPVSAWFYEQPLQQHRCHAINKLPLVLSNIQNQIFIILAVLRRSV